MYPALQNYTVAVAEHPEHVDIHMLNAYIGQGCGFSLPWDAIPALVTQLEKTIRLNPGYGAQLGLIGEGTDATMIMKIFAWAIEDLLKLLSEAYINRERHGRDGKG